jgi:hypothetical protein
MSYGGTVFHEEVKTPTVKPHDIDTQLYETRTLVFLETAPQSNTYNQVLLDSDTFKKMTDVISVSLGRAVNGIEDRSITSSEEEYKLPDLQSYDQTTRR